MTMMDKYSIICQIGKGACGAVYLVRNNENKKLFALKKIQLDESRKTRTKEAVQREARILSELKHPHIVSYHESFFDEKEEHLCIIQDYCDGGTLEDRVQEVALKRQYLPEDLVMQWFVQVALAVRYMHSKKVLHRDLKASNVFLNKKGTLCKVGDFGIAKSMDATIEVASTCVGTPCYLSPEMCQDIPYSSKADLWALGCMLYEMLAQKPAFDAQNLVSLFYKIVRGEFDPLPSCYSENVLSLVQQVLVKSPEERPSARGVLAIPFVRSELVKFIEEQSFILEQRRLPTRQGSRPYSTPNLMRASNFLDQQGRKEEEGTRDDSSAKRATSCRPTMVHRKEKSALPRTRKVSDGRVSTIPEEDSEDAEKSQRMDKDARNKSNAQRSKSQTPVEEVEQQQETSSPPSAESSPKHQSKGSTPQSSASVSPSGEVNERDIDCRKLPSLNQKEHEAVAIEGKADSGVEMDGDSREAANGESPEEETESKTKTARKSPVHSVESFKTAVKRETKESPGTPRRVKKHHKDQLELLASPTFQWKIVKEPEADSTSSPMPTRQVVAKHLHQKDCTSPVPNTNATKSPSPSNYSNQSNRAVLKLDLTKVSKDRDGVSVESESTKLHKIQGPQRTPRIQEPMALIIQVDTCASSDSTNTTVQALPKNNAKPTNITAANSQKKNASSSSKEKNKNAVNTDKKNTNSSRSKKETSAKSGKGTAKNSGKSSRGSQRPNTQGSTLSVPNDVIDYYSDDFDESGSDIEEADPCASEPCKNGRICTPMNAVAYACKCEKLVNDGNWTIVDILYRIRITNRIFISQYSNQLSNEYVTFTLQLRSVLDQLYQALFCDRYLGIANITLTNGSVIQESVVRLLMSEEESDEDIASEMVYDTKEMMSFNSPYAVGDVAVVNVERIGHTDSRPVEPWDRIDEVLPVGSPASITLIVVGVIMVVTLSALLALIFRMILRRPHKHPDSAT